MSIYSWRVRSQPCSGCGGKVVVTRTRLTGLGGMWRIDEPERMQHADFEPGSRPADQIDADCLRGLPAEPAKPE